MISERLRPGALHVRPMTGRGWLGTLLLGGLFTAGLFVLGIANLAIGLLTLVAIVLCMRRFDRAFGLLLGLGMSMSYGTLLALRPTIGKVQIPINALDMAAVILLVACLLQMVGWKDSLSFPAYLRSPYLLFLAMTVFGMVYGLAVNGGSFYTYLQDARLVLTLHLTLLSVAFFVRTTRQLRWIANLLVFGACVTALQQLARLFLFNTEGSGAIRDTYLPVQGIPIAVMILTIYRYHGIRLGPRNSYPFLIGLLLVALLLCLTRSVWMMMILSYVLGWFYMGQSQKARSALIAIGVLAALLFVIPFTLELFYNGLDLQQLIMKRQANLFSSNDFAKQARIFATVDAWFIYLQSPVWGSGLGKPIYLYSNTFHQMVEDDLLHNSPLYYGIKIGGIGFLALIWLTVAALRRAMKAAAPTSDDLDQAEKKAFSQALIAGMVPFLLIGPWSGNLNYIAFMPILGLFIGLNWDRIGEARFSSKIPAWMTNARGFEASRVGPTSTAGGAGSALEPEKG